MAKLSIGYLFKRKYVTYEGQKYEIFEFLDYVAAISFTNTDNNDRVNVLTGDKVGTYASVLNKNGNDEEQVFLFDDINTAITDNDNHVNFIDIRKMRMEQKAKYYLRKDDGSGLISLVNNELISFLNKENQKGKSEFDEGVFEKRTYISSIYSSVKDTIVSQDEQIMQILTALFKNQKVVNSGISSDLIAKLKENVLIYGPTGTGKTEILKRISKLLSMPIVIEDASLLCETGNHGKTITDMLEDLCLAAGGDIENAEKGILVIDEFDKLADKNEGRQSQDFKVSVQRSLLKLLDGTLFSVGDKKFDTSKLTVVAVGKFDGITDNYDYKHLTNDDFIRYGIMNELMDSFSQTIAMNNLFKEDIVKILKYSDFSPINAYKKLFQLLQVEFEFNEEFIDYIAELVIAKKSGARSLKTVFDDCINSALFRIFAGEYSGISLVKPSNENEKPYVLTRSK